MISSFLNRFWIPKRGFDRNSNEVPVIVDSCCEYLEKNGLKEEGIFRLSASLTEIRSLKKLFDDGNQVDLTGKNVHLVAGVLKLFFMDYEESILTSELYDAFLESVDVPEIGRIDCISAVVEKLPPGNKVITQRLFRLLAMISQEENVIYTKMNPKNLGIVFGPSLLRKNSQSLEDTLKDTNRICTLIEILIENRNKIFDQNNEEDSKKLQTESLVQSSTDFSQGIHKKILYFI